MKFKHIGIIISIAFTLIWPATALAGDLRIGQECTKDSDCITDNCEGSDQLKEKKYCVCRATSERDCSIEYEFEGDPTAEITETQAEERWECKQGGSGIACGINYCLNLESEEGKGQPSYAAGPCDPVLSDVITDTTAVISTVNEIDKLMKTPTPKIEIPGLQFSEITKTEDVWGTTWLNIPFFGEYLSAVYKFSVVAISILAVIGLIDGGITWVLRGGSQEGREIAQKRIIGSVTGLIIAVGSYTILYTLNPELVQFRNLKVRYVENQDMQEFLDETEGMTDWEFQNGSGNPQFQYITGINTPGITGGSEKGIVREPDKTKAVAMASDLTKLWCTSPENPSERPPELESFLSGKNIQVDWSVFGTMDCSKGQDLRPNAQIDRIITHSGYSQGGNNGLSKAKLTVIDWRTRLLQNGDKVSAHFIIDRQGVVYPLVDPRFFASHAPSQNKRGIGIDFLWAGGKLSNNTFTMAQYKSAGALITYLMTKFPKIKPTDYNIMGHGECQSNRQDPTNFDYQKLGLYLAGSSFNNSAHNRTFLSPDYRGVSDPKNFSKNCEIVQIKGVGKVKCTSLGANAPYQCRSLSDPATPAPVAPAPITGRCDGTTDINGAEITNPEECFNSNGTWVPS